MIMAGASKELAPDDVGNPKPTRRIAGVSIMNVIASFAKKISTVAAVYLLGYFQFSAAWLVGPIIFSVIRDEWRKEKELKRTIAKAAAMCNEKDVILARVDDLPSWVFFPDVERVEWLNKILRQVWPNVNHYAKDLIKETIEPAVAESLASYKLNGFQFQKMILGTIPPRIGGIKVYDKNVSRNEILMDLDVFFASDCDISFTLGGVSGGIKDFQIHGMVRVVMKPLITKMPMVGGLQIFFLNNPNIDFNLVGVADVLDMPGLSDLLRRIIVEQVATMMVLPNKLPIHLSDAVPATALKTRDPEGVLRVHVVEAKDLMKKDIGVLGKGKSDPYAIITVGAQTFKTKIIDNTVNPKWDYWCEFEILDVAQEMLIVIKDHDDLAQKNPKLGSVKSSFQPTGRKFVLFVFLARGSGYCHCLQFASRGFNKHDSVLVDGNSEFYYLPISVSRLPWLNTPEALPVLFIFIATFAFKVEDLKGQYMDVALLDHDNTGKDENLGRATLEISRVAKRGHLDTWITLEEAKHGMVHLRLTWFRLSSDPADLKEALAETQMLRVTSMSSALLTIFIDSIKNLPNARPQSKPDPYVSVTLAKTTKSTHAQWRTDCPVYEQGFAFLVNNPEVDTLHLKVTDNKTGKDIGELIYNVSQLLEKANMIVDNQPFQLKKSGGESKILISMQLKILKFETPLETEGSFDEQSLAGDVSPPATEKTTVDSFLKKQDSFLNRRQGSVRSNKSVDAALPSSLPSVTPEDEFIKSEVEAVQRPPSKRLGPRTDSTLSNISNLSNMSDKGEHGLGRILLSLGYSMSRQRLEVTVHRISNLPLNDPNNIPDPYVKLYLLPERNKDSKRKTEAIKDNCNPVYEQLFEYIISAADLGTRQLEVSVATKKGIFSSSSNCMGQVLINLNELDLNTTTTEWFDLLPEFHKDKDD